MDRVENTVHCCTPVVSMGTCSFAKAFLSNVCVYLHIKNPLHSSECFVVSRSLPSNESTHYSILKKVLLKFPSDITMGFMLVKHICHVIIIMRGNMFYEPIFFPNGSSSPFRAQAFLFSPVIIFTDGRTPWTSDQPITRPLPIHRTTQT
jgi:hypothetical protein